jgi:hypothetical protein
MNKKKCKMKSKSKKAESQWISFVLLTAFVVVSSALIYNWLIAYVKGSGQNIQKVVYNYDLCDYISVSIDESCTNSQSLYINVTNRNNLRVNALVIGIFSPEGILNVDSNVTIKPGKQKRLNIQTNFTNITSIQVTPAIFKDDMMIICTDKKTSSNPILC